IGFQLERISIFRLRCGDDTGGPRKITLPKQAKRVTEAFSGKVVAENAKEFEYEFAEPETALFVLE
ncbi:MAG: hypothetical protein ACI4QC_01835, partial [Thermoguttaceae bacterium]